MRRSREVPRTKTLTDWAQAAATAAKVYFVWRSYDWLAKASALVPPEPHLATLKLRPAKTPCNPLLQPPIKDTGMTEYPDDQTFEGGG